MTVIVNLFGKTDMADNLATFLSTCTLHLFGNNVVPTPASVLGDFLECGFAGYSPAAIPSPTSVFLNVGNQGEADFDPIVFTCTGDTPPQNVYGAYITDPAGQLVAAGRGPASGPSAVPFDVSAAGATWYVRIVLVVDNL